jgi:hypothetical protein
VKAVSAILAVWLLSGAGAVGGSIVGNAAGKTGLFVCAFVGGLLAAAGAASFSARVGWIDATRRRHAMFGAMAGFALAAVIAVTNLHTPVIPVLATALAGVGAVLGGTLARSQEKDG